MTKGGTEPIKETFPEEYLYAAQRTSGRPTAKASDFTITEVTPVIPGDYPRYADIGHNLNRGQTDEYKPHSATLQRMMARTPKSSKKPAVVDRPLNSNQGTSRRKRSSNQQMRRPVDETEEPKPEPEIPPPEFEATFDEGNSPNAGHETEMEDPGECGTGESEEETEEEDQEGDQSLELAKGGVPAE